MKTARPHGMLAAAATLTVLAGLTALAGCGTSASSPAGVPGAAVSGAAEMNPASARR